MPPQDDPAPGTSKSLTPLRKHRKLLKDGSGTAVWPEAIEAVFVQGLREYWDSPWATYSRGRSRWRNQFLVEYLANHGIERTKKQVASHIQVLRNMWKGDSQYHLVAGGEDSFPQEGQQSEQEEPHFREGRPPSHLFRDSFDVKSEAHSPLLTIDPDDDPSSSPTTSLPSLSFSPTSPISSIPEIDSPPHAYAALVPTNNAQKYSPGVPYGTFAGQSFGAAVPVHPIRATTFTLRANGMTPLTISLDRLYTPNAPPARTPPLALKLKVKLPAWSFPGPAGAAVITAPCAEAFVHSTRYDDLNHQVGANQDPAVARSASGAPEIVFPPFFSSYAPDSVDAMTITQNLVVDGHTLLFVMYEIEFGGPGSTTQASLHSFQPCVLAGREDYGHMSYEQPAQYPAPYYAQSQNEQSHGRRMYASSLSAALTPVS